MTIYLNAGYDGTIYESSKTPKEGFEEHISTKGNISYRKVYKKGLYGIYKSIELRDSKIGQQLSIHVVDQHNNTIYFQIPFKDQKGDIGTFAESILAKLPYMQAEFLYRFYAYNMPVEGKTYSNIGISIKHANPDWETVREDIAVGQLTFSYTVKATGETVAGDVPAVVWTTTFDNKNVADKAAKNAYLYGVLTQYGTVQAPTTPAAAPAVAAAAPPVAAAPVAVAAQPPVVAAPVAQPAAQPVAVAAAPAAQPAVAQQAVEYVAPPADTGANDDLPF